MLDAEKNIKVPENIDEYIKKGITLGIKKKKTNRVKLMTSSVLISIFTIFTVLTRTSSAFAAYMTQVPGLEYLVKFINNDKGLEAVIENNFVENINCSMTQDGLKFTIKDIIVDNSRGVIFYSIENQGNHRFVNLSNIKLKNENGEDVMAFQDWDLFANKDMSIEKIIEGKIDISFSPEITIPNKLCIEVKLKEALSLEEASNHEEKVLEPTWKFELPIDKEKISSMQKNYNTDETVEIEGQKILIKKVTITPTRTAVEIEYDKSNSKKILGYDNIEMVDENGKSYTAINNGASRIIKDEYTEILYLQSNYFENPKELYIKATGIRALDKDRLTAVVDLDKSKLIKSPNDKLTLKEINKSGEEISIIFNLEKDKVLDNKFSYFVFSTKVKDSKGNVYFSGLSSSNNLNSNIQYISVMIKPNSELKEFIVLDIEDYPERVEGDFKVKIY